MTAAEIKPKGHNRYGNPKKKGTVGFTNHATLRDKIVESSGYYKYEVEDILNHLIAHIQKDLSQGIAVKVDGLGWFSRRFSKPRKFLDLSGVYRKSFTSPSVTLKPDGYLKTAMKKTFNDYVRILVKAGHIPEGYDQEEDVDVARKFKNKD